MPFLYEVEVLCVLEEVREQSGVEYYLWGRYEGDKHGKMKMEQRNKVSVEFGVFWKVKE
jgi:hypothetical protein